MEEDDDSQSGSDEGMGEEDAEKSKPLPVAEDMADIEDAAGDEDDGISVNSEDEEDQKIE